MPITDPHQRGAHAIDDDHRRRRAAWLWWLLVLLLIAAVVLGIGAARGWFSDDDDGAASGSSTSTTASVAGQPGGSESAGQTSSTAGGASASDAPAPPGSSAAPYGLVGGGGVPATTAAPPVGAPGVVGTVLFAEAGADLDAAAMQVVSDAAERISAKQGARVAVTGYTDGLGDPNANQELSLQRARAVIAALEGKIGSGVTFDEAAFGQTQPIASNDTPEGRQINRRVTIVLS